MPKINIIPIKLKPEHRTKAINELIAHAKKTKSTEPGCLRFDIVQDSSDPTKIWLYEVYNDEKAVLEHNDTEYMAKRNNSEIWDWREPNNYEPCIGHNIWPDDDLYK
ncbi:MAG: hypothetical protein CL758_08945 [Chloroflexi bacterium]|nr:hypothetical protein [Chloroflexota bacterium]|tara:strand:+ start:12056 stop:12376 length:321 start_codon:yes stop_codon:yes gene_type:complete